MAYVLKAWLIAQTANVWGDIPYAQAADSTIVAPALDPQQLVYTTIQAKLYDTAIRFLATATAPPAGEDMVYGGDLLQVDGAGQHARPLLPAHGGARD